MYQSRYRTRAPKRRPSQSQLAYPSKYQAAVKRRRFRRNANAYAARRPINRGNNILYGREISVPEMNHRYSSFAITNFTSSTGITSIPVTDYSGYTEPIFPIIPISAAEGCKIGNKCCLRRITIKCTIKRDYTSFMENFHMWLVRKAQVNRAGPNAGEIWEPSSGVVASQDFRNTKYLEQYTVLKHWRKSLITPGEDDASYPVIGIIQGFIPSFTYFEKTFTISDLYDNDDTLGRTTGNTGAGYCLFIACEGLSDGWILPQAGYTVKGSISVSFTEK